MKVLVVTVKGWSGQSTYFIDHLKTIGIDPIIASEPKTGELDKTKKESDLIVYHLPPNTHLTLPFISQVSRDFVTYGLKAAFVADPESSQPFERQQVIDFFRGLKSGRLFSNDVSFFIWLVQHINILKSKQTDIEPNDEQLY